MGVLQFSGGSHLILTFSLYIMFVIKTTQTASLVYLSYLPFFLSIISSFVHWYVYFKYARLTFIVQNLNLFSSSALFPSPFPQDTNSHFMTKRLHALGVRVSRISVIPDQLDIIAEEVKKFSGSYDHVVTSGGIGPTHDDLTFEGGGDV